MMRVLLSTIGSRGDVQPLVALGLELKSRGQEVRLCVPPDFRDWIESLGIPVTPIGPAVRGTASASRPAKQVPPSPEQRRQMVEAAVATQFEVIGAAAQGCDIMVGATALQIAAPSVAEKAGIPYVFVAYCPAVLPSPHHAPPPLSMLGQTPASPTTDNRTLWAQDAERLNATWGDALNSQRSAIGLAPVDDVRGHIFTAQPWLAADPTLAPWPDPSDKTVFQSGAWIVPDDRPLSPELETFLKDGEPPIYFGFGSTRAPQDASQTIVRTARALGCRAIVSRGWADLSPLDDEPDCLAIGEANLATLFKRVSVVAHHGGAGTMTAAAHAGTPQVIIPQLYDQHYWARRIQDLGIGIAHAPGVPTAESLEDALRNALQPQVVANVQSISTKIRGDGVQLAAQKLIQSRAATRRGPLGS